MKNIILALLFLVLLGVASAISFNLLKPDSNKSIEQAAYEFFHQLSSGHSYDAFRSTAAKIQNSRFPHFESSLARHGLTEATDIKIAPPLVGATEATINATFEDASDETKKITLNMIYQGGRWKVYSILSEEVGDLLKTSAPKVTPQDETVTVTIPTNSELQDLTVATMMSFNEAVQLRYFALFYQNISQAWQHQTSPAKLTSIFAPFMKKNVSFPEIAHMQAEYTEKPSIDENGLLHLRGFYQHPNYDIRFYLRYTYEHPKWRLFGIDIDLVSSSATPKSTPKP